MFQATFTVTFPYAAVYFLLYRMATSPYTGLTLKTFESADGGIHLLHRAIRALRHEVSEHHFRSGLETYLTSIGTWWHMRPFWAVTFLWFWGDDVHTVASILQLSKPTAYVSRCSAPAQNSSSSPSRRQEKQRAYTFSSMQDMKPSSPLASKSAIQLRRAKQATPNSPRGVNEERPSHNKNNYNQEEKQEEKNLRSSFELNEEEDVEEIFEFEYNYSTSTITSVWEIELDGFPSPAGKEVGREPKLKIDDCDL